MIVDFRLQVRKNWQNVDTNLIFNLFYPTANRKNSCIVVVFIIIQFITKKYNVWFVALWSQNWSDFSSWCVGGGAHAVRVASYWRNFTFTSGASDSAADGGMKYDSEFSHTGVSGRDAHHELRIAYATKYWLVKCVKRPDYSDEIRLFLNSFRCFRFYQQMIVYHKGLNTF